MTRHAGKVTWFDQANGYGFLACGHEADVFADAASIERESLLLIKRGDRVQFDIVDSEVGPKARSVARIAFSSFADARSGTSICLQESAKSEADARRHDAKTLQTLLLIDDDDRLRIMKDDFLTAAGYFVVACKNIQLAVEVHQSSLPIDLVIVNLRPSHGKASLLKGLDFLGRTIPVLLSDRAFTPALWSQIQNRGWEFLEAVCPMPVLLSAVRSMLRPVRLDAA